MKITLTKNSWHFKFYEYITGSSTPPMSLCPYFWSLVGLFVLLPLIFIIKGIILFFDVRDKILNGIKEKRKEKEKSMTSEQIQNYYERKMERVVKRSNIINNIGKIFFSVAIAGALILFITLIIISASEIGWMKLLLITAIAITVMSLISGIVWFLGNFNYGRIFNLSIVKMTVGIIRSVYTKTCPIIDWKEEEKEEEKEEKYEY